MRKAILGIVGATALALGSAANAAITVTNPVNLTTLNSVTVAGVTTIDYSKNPEPTSSFTGSFDINNTAAGVYSILLGSSTPGVLFGSASLSGILGTVGTYNLTGGGTNVMQLSPTTIGAGDYRFSFAGTNSNVSGVAGGNVTISAVPEPSTWALMILGFGAIGLTMRGRRRRTVLAQVA
jgi:hypothetical protein